MGRKEKDAGKYNKNNPKNLKITPQQKKEGFEIVPCITCGGSGTNGNRTCGLCGGSGRIKVCK